MFAGPTRRGAGDLKSFRRVGKAKRAYPSRSCSRTDWWAQRFAPLPTLRHRCPELVLQLRLDHRLSDLRTAVGAFIGEVDLRHAPMRFDIPHIHRKPDAAWTNDKGWLDVVVMVDIGWHVDTPHESIHQ